MALESPLIIIIEMIKFLIGSGIKAINTLLGMFLNLLGSLGFISAIGGIGVLILSVIIIAVVVFFLGKFVFSAGKGVIFLFIAGIIVVFLLLLGLALG